MVVRTASSKRAAAPTAQPTGKPAHRKTDTASHRKRKARAAAKAAAGREAEAQKVEAMPVTNRQAAGVDIGGSSHWVCVGFTKDDDPRLVKEFPAHTDGLRAILAYLHEHNVTTVAMEATGIYWVPLFEMLEQNGFEVLLVDPSYTKQLRGRPKTDKRDAQWIYRLHSVGLLAGAFRPDEKTAVLRNYLRQRGNLIRYGGKHIQHMQKALEQMNLKLTLVLSDITGLTGRKIIEAILAGERDPMKLAQLRHPRCQALSEEIARALDGSYRDEHLFALKQAYEAWRFYQKQLDAVDEQIAEQLQRMKQSKELPALSPKKSTQTRKANGMRFDVRTALYYVTGVDLTEVEGLDESGGPGVASGGEQPALEQGGVGGVLAANERKDRCAASGDGDGAQAGAFGVLLAEVWNPVCEAIAGGIREEDAREADSQRQEAGAGVGSGSDRADSRGEGGGEDADRDNKPGRGEARDGAGCEQPEGKAGQSREDEQGSDGQEE